MKVRNYELSNDGVLLYISHNGKQYYTEYTPEIEGLLSSGILGSFSNNGKRGGYYPKFDLGPSKRRYTPYLHHIIYCVHHYGMTTQNHMDILQEFHCKLKNTKGCVDHLHDGLDNCCISNLHFMTLQDHYRKTSAEHSSRLRAIRNKATFFHVIKANDGDCIRVQIAYSSSSIRKRIRLLRLYCETDKAFVDLLTHINAGSIWKMVNERKGIVCDDDSYTFSGDFLCCPKVIPQKPIYALQHDLLKMELSEFSQWEVIDKK